MVISLPFSVQNAQRPLAKIGNKEGGGREETDFKLESEGHADVAGGNKPAQSKRVNAGDNVSKIVTI